MKRWARKPGPAATVTRTERNEQHKLAYKERKALAKLHPELKTKSMLAKEEAGRDFAEFAATKKKLVNLETVV